MWRITLNVYKGQIERFVFAKNNDINFTEGMVGMSISSSYKVMFEYNAIEETILDALESALFAYNAAMSHTSKIVTLTHLHDVVGFDFATQFSAAGERRESGQAKSA